MAEHYSLNEVGQGDSQSMAEAEQFMYPELPETRTDLDYKWRPVPVSEVLNALRKFLERNDAKGYMMDVYASNNEVYRNMLIHIPGVKDGVFLPESISMQFNRDEGRQFMLVNEIPEPFGR